ncbi:hypothetical protein SELMODRAFT_419611 [Selaginella moellendorffii]|uniref:Uncharacterized protein n=1 Tax=Selaginella moellendorffii TaxID=88036 RepID=D8S9H5_SELML|nr:hypothetical protein SELMODRAFT_419611 [Selaginella moellendorffii]
MGHSKELVVELPRVMKVEKILFSSNTNNLECEVFGKEDQDGEWMFLGKTGREARFKLTKLRFILVKPLSGFEVSTIVSFYSKDNAQKPVEELELKYINPQKVDYQNPFKVGQLSKDTLVTKAIVRSNLRYYKFRLWGNIEYPCQWWFPMGDYDQDEPNPSQGHVVPLVYLARKLALLGVTMTIINVDSIHETLQQSWTSEANPVNNGQDIRLESIEDPLAELFAPHAAKKRLDWLERAFGREVLLGMPSNSTFQSSWRWETFLSKMNLVFHVVLYVSFGSISFMTAKQFEEITLGLEASKVPFLWVI